jgi:sugar/nucleoside kinase (ribokinase family)
VLDEVFRLERFPPPGGKTPAQEVFSVNGGCAANAAVAIARLGGRARLAGPLGGPAGEDPYGDRVLAALARERVDCSGCQRLLGVASPISAIFLDRSGERMIATYRDPRLAAASPADPRRLVASVDAVLLDNRYPQFVRPIGAAARARGVPVVLDADRPTEVADELFRMATHVVFSGECLRATSGREELGSGLEVIAAVTRSFLAVTDGPRDVLWRDGASLKRCPVFAVKAVDTLAAGDVFHGAFTLALAEGREIAAGLRFAAAAASLKCARLGGGAAAPRRHEVEHLLAQQPPTG